MSMECKSLDLKFSRVAQCKLKALRPDVTEVTMEAILLQKSKPLDNITIWATVRRRGVQVGKPLLEFRVDLCAFMRNTRRNLLAELAYKILGFEKWSNINHTCPYKHDLLVNKYPFDGKRMGRFVPLQEGRYSLVGKWFFYDILRIILTVHFQVYEK
ncbi:PREDICTED: uncharacterized protein LOC108373446 isoform X2 [Rhagoletis zephyria]|nr:PREDICTED: uncharacterized protein LOC108373446 isoform X2 [Rhagoletis zephyria]